MDSDLARIDFINAWAVGRAADQIAEAVEASEPARRLKGLAFEQWHDLRGRVDAVPGLGLCFSTAMGLKAGIAEARSGGPFTHVLFLPNFLSRGLNERTVRTQTLVHHEVAHVVCGHEIGSDGVFAAGPEYFRDPREIEAYFHQGLAGVVREAAAEAGLPVSGWHDGDPSLFCGADAHEFRERFKAEVPAAFLDALGVAGRLELYDRLDAFRRRVMGHADEPVPPVFR